MSDPTLDALRASVSGWQKRAALELADAEGASEGGAEARLSKVLAGSLNIPADLLRVALQGPTPEPLLDHLCDLAGAGWEPRRSEDLAAAAAQRLDELLAGVDEVRGYLARAEDLRRAEGERLKPRKVRASERDRGAA